MSEWKLVPRRPTPEMIAAGGARLVLRDSHERREAEAERAWLSMYEAAPAYFTQPAQAPAFCSHCGLKASDVKSCSVGGCPLGADL